MIGKCLQGQDLMTVVIKRAVLEHRKKRQRTLLARLAGRGLVDQLQDEWAAGDDTCPAGKEVASNDVLKDTRLPRGLASQHSNLREINGVLDAYAGEGILQLVDELW